MQYNELYHHGRLGQKWGVRNGPPYPLTRSMIGQAYGKKKRRGISGYLQRRKEKKIAKQEEEKEKQRKAAEETQRKYDEEKARVLRQGSATEVMKYKKELTKDELRDVLDRIKWTNELSNLASSEVQDGWKKIDNIMKRVGDVRNWTGTTVGLWRNIDDLLGLMDGKKK